MSNLIIILEAAISICIGVATIIFFILNKIIKK